MGLQPGLLSSPTALPEVGQWGRPEVRLLESHGMAPTHQVLPKYTHSLDGIGMSSAIAEARQFPGGASFSWCHFQDTHSEDTDILGHCGSGGLVLGASSAVTV